MWSVVATVMCGQWWSLSCVVSGGSLSCVVSGGHCHVWSMVAHSLSCVVSGGSLTVMCGQCMTHCHVWSVVAHYHVWSVYDSLSRVVSV